MINQKILKIKLVNQLKYYRHNFKKFRMNVISIKYYMKNKKTKKRKY